MQERDGGGTEVVCFLLLLMHGRLALQCAAEGQVLRSKKIIPPLQLLLSEDLYPGTYVRQGELYAQTTNTIKV